MSPTCCAGPVGRRLWSAGRLMPWRVPAAVHGTTPAGIRWRIRCCHHCWSLASGGAGRRARRGKLQALLADLWAQGPMATMTNRETPACAKEPGMGIICSCLLVSILAGSRDCAWRVACWWGCFCLHRGAVGAGAVCRAAGLQRQLSYGGLVLGDACGQRRHRRLPGHGAAVSTLVGRNGLPMAGAGMRRRGWCCWQPMRCLTAYARGLYLTVVITAVGMAGWRNRHRLKAPDATLWHRRPWRIVGGSGGGTWRFGWAEPSCPIVWVALMPICPAPGPLKRGAYCIRPASGCWALGSGRCRRYSAEPEGALPGQGAGRHGDAGNEVWLYGPQRADIKVAWR